MAPQHFGEIWIPFRCEHGHRVAQSPEQKTCDPHAQSKPQSRCNRPIRDGERARRAGQQNWFGEGVVQRHFKAFGHETSAPPPKEKNDRKKLEAAKAIDRPSTI